MAVKIKNNRNQKQVAAIKDRKQITNAEAVNKSIEDDMAALASANNTKQIADILQRVLVRQQQLIAYING